MRKYKKELIREYVVDANLIKKSYTPHYAISS